MHSRRRKKSVSSGFFLFEANCWLFFIGACHPLSTRLFQHCEWPLFGCVFLSINERNFWFSLCALQHQCHLFCLFEGHMPWKACPSVVKFACLCLIFPSPSWEKIIRWNIDDCLTVKFNISMSLVEQLSMLSRSNGHFSQLTSAYRWCKDFSYSRTAFCSVILSIIHRCRHDEKKGARERGIR